MSIKGVPTISMNQPWPTFCKAFGEAIQGIGFAVVSDHGITPELFARSYDVLRRSFGLPEEVKRRCEIAEHTSGFIPYRTEHAKDDPRPDEKEIWDTRFRGPFFREGQFPSEVPDFRPVIGGLFDGLDQLSLRLLEALDAYLEPPQSLRAMADGGDSLLRLLHYPALKGDEPGMRSAPHEDINFITLLPVATAPGLQVKTTDGRWLDVACGPDTIIVNSGDMLKVYSEHIGKPMPSTTHQVINLPGERYSMPYFVHPRPEVLLRQGLTAGAYLLQRLREIGLIA